MFTKMKMVFAVIALTFSSVTFAKVSGPVWACSLSKTSMHGFTAAIGPSLSMIRGNGVVHCQSLLGPDQIDTPVKVSLWGLGAGLGYAYVTDLEIGFAAVGVATPNDLYGTFRLQGEASVIFLENGASVLTYTAVNKMGLSVGFGFAGYEAYGLDANAELRGVTIVPIN